MGIEANGVVCTGLASAKVGNFTTLGSCTGASSWGATTLVSVPIVGVVTELSGAMAMLYVQVLQVLHESWRREFPNQVIFLDCLQKILNCGK